MIITFCDNNLFNCLNNWEKWKEGLWIACTYLSSVPWVVSDLASGGWNGNKKPT